jgi:hypothetical protein
MNALSRSSKTLQTPIPIRTTGDMKNHALQDEKGVFIITTVFHNALYRTTDSGDQLILYVVLYSNPKNQAAQMYRVDHLTSVIMKAMLQVP